MSIKEYKGQFDDELSFDGMVVLEVLNKVLDGWWVARLVEQTNPFLFRSSGNSYFSDEGGRVLWKQQNKMVEHFL